MVGHDHVMARCEQVGDEGVALGGSESASGGKDRVALDPATPDEEPGVVTRLRRAPDSPRAGEVAHGHAQAEVGVGVLARLVVWLGN